MRRSGTSALLGALCLAALVLSGQAIPKRSSLHLKGHARVMIEDVAPASEQSGWSSVDATAETQQRMFYKYKVPPTPTEPAQSTTFASDEPEPDMSFSSEHTDIYWHGYAQRDETGSVVGITDPAAVIASEGDGAELSLSEQHSAIYNHGYSKVGYAEPSTEHSATPTEQAPAEASGIASTDEGAAVDGSSWSADGTVAQTQNQYYFKYKVPPVPESPPQGSALASDDGPDMSFSSEHTDIYWHGYAQRDETGNVVALTSADEGVAVPGSETSVVANADGSSDESSQLSLSETHSTIYWHGYRFGIPAGTYAPSAAPAPSEETESASIASASEGSSFASASGEHSSGGPNFRLPNRPAAPKEPPMDTSNWRSGRRLNRRALVEQASESLKQGGSKLFGFISLPWRN